MQSAGLSFIVRYAACALPLLSSSVWANYFIEFPVFSRAAIRVDTDRECTPASALVRRREAEMIADARRCESALCARIRSIFCIAIITRPSAASGALAEEFPVCQQLRFRPGVIGGKQIRFNGCFARGLIAAGVHRGTLLRLLPIRVHVAMKI